MRGKALNILLFALTVLSTYLIGGGWYSLSLTNTTATLGDGPPSTTMQSSDSKRVRWATGIRQSIVRLCEPKANPHHSLRHELMQPC